MSKYILQTEEWPRGWRDVSLHDSYDETVEAAGKLFDTGDPGDFCVRDIETKHGTILRGYTFQPENCPICQRYIRLRDMMATYDCHGIRFRSVCPECYDKIMDEKGYDGEYYTELDECIGFDY